MDNEGVRKPLPDRRKMLLGAFCTAGAYVTYKMPDLLDEKTDREEIERLCYEISRKYEIEVEVPLNTVDIHVGHVVQGSQLVDKKIAVKSAYTFVARRTLEVVKTELSLYPKEYLHGIGLTKILIGSRLSGVDNISFDGTAARSGQVGLYVGPISNPHLVRVYGVLHHEFGHLLHFKFIDELSKEWGTRRLSLLEMKEEVANLTNLMFSFYLDISRRLIKTKDDTPRGDEAFQESTRRRVKLIKRLMAEVYPLMNEQYWDDVIHGRVDENYWDRRRQANKLP